MKQNMKTKEINIGGMTCVNCENKIERVLKKKDGIKAVKVSYSSGKAHITYDESVIKLEEIERLIEDSDYQVVRKPDAPARESDIYRIISAGAIIYAAFMILRHSGLMNVFNAFPEAEAGMGYGMLFLIGLLTSVHCIAMCGGINLSQCMPQGIKISGEGSRFAALRPSVLYNTGRVVSYTVIGGLVGALGSVVSFSGSAKGLVQILAGVFMVIMGLNMLNIFPWLRKLNIRMPKVFAEKIDSKRGSNSPLYVGLLNGLMPCGPLQAMQLYALSTADPFKGAASMFVFSLGTVPLMFIFGAISSILSRRFTKRVMSAGAVLVVMLGISMFNSGLSLSGLLIPTGNETAPVVNQAETEGDIQLVSTSLKSGRYQPITVQVGVPVKWTINVEPGTLSGCNNRMIIPEYQIEKKFAIGENVVEFTPTETGTYSYSCWMGMIRSTITVVD